MTKKQVSAKSSAKRTRSGSAWDTSQFEELITKVADQFMQRIENGEDPNIEEYVAQHPGAADLIRRTLTALKTMRSVDLWKVGLIDDSYDTCSTQQERFEIGDFRLNRVVGRGGMGVVYEAQQISLHRKVALKVLPYAAMLDERSLQRFRNEVIAAAQLDHANIVPVYGVGCERGVHHYAMRLIDGITLSQVIVELRDLQKNNMAFPASLASLASTGECNEELANSYIQVANSPDRETQAVMQTQTVCDSNPFKNIKRSHSHFRSMASLGATVADALHHAHQHGVIHRDIKPSNLMIDAVGKPWVADFGLAQVETNTALTMTGDLLGTARYMSPEQLMAKRLVLDNRTDVYSLGVTLYQLLTLELPFDSDSRQELFRQIMMEEPRKLRKINPSIPEDLETIVLKAIEKNPNDRYQTAQELSDDLTRFVETKPIVARRPSLWNRSNKWISRHSGLVWTVSLFTLLLTVLLAVSTVLALKANRRISTAMSAVEDARANAETEQRRATKTLNWFVNTLQSPLSADRADITVVEILLDAADNVEFEFRDEPILQAKILQSIADTFTYLKRGDDALPIAIRAREILQHELGPNHLETLTAFHYVYWAHRCSSGFEIHRQRLLEEGLQLEKETINQLGDDAVTTVLIKLAVLDATLPEAKSLYVKGAHGVPYPGPDLSAVTAGIISAIQDWKGDPSKINDLEHVLKYLADYRFRMGDYSDALRLYDELLLSLETRHPPSHIRILETKSNICQVRSIKGNHDDATSSSAELLRTYESKFGKHAHQTLVRRGEHATILSRQTSRKQEAQALVDQVAEHALRSFGESSLTYSSILDRQAMVYLLTNNLDRATEIFDRRLDSSSNDNWRKLATAINNDWRTLVRDAQPEVSIRLFNYLIRRFKQRACGTSDSDLFSWAHAFTITLAKLYNAMGRDDDCLQAFQDSLKISEQSYSLSAHDRLFSVTQLMSWHLKRENWREMNRLCEERVRLIEGHFSENQRAYAHGQYWLGVSCFYTGQYSKAIKSFESYLQTVNEIMGPSLGLDRAATVDEVLEYCRDKSDGESQKYVTALGNLANSHVHADPLEDSTPFEDAIPIMKWLLTFWDQVKDSNPTAAGWCWPGLVAAHRIYYVQALITCDPNLANKGSEISRAQGPRQSHRHST